MVVGQCTLSHAWSLGCRCHHSRVQAGGHVRSSGWDGDVMGIGAGAVPPVVTGHPWPPLEWQAKVGGAGIPHCCFCGCGGSHQFYHFDRWCCSTWLDCHLTVVAALRTATALIIVPSNCSGNCSFSHQGSGRPSFSHRCSPVDSLLPSGFGDFPTTSWGGEDGFPYHL